MARGSSTSSSVLALPMLSEGEHAQEVASVTSLKGCGPTLDSTDRRARAVLGAMGSSWLHQSHGRSIMQHKGTEKERRWSPPCHPPPVAEFQGCR